MTSDDGPGPSPVLTAILRLRAAWTANDADALADLFTENGSLLIGDDQLVSRDEIRSYLTNAFAGGFGGSRLDEHPREIRLLSAGVAVAVTEGGLVAAGRDAPDPADVVRAMWVIIERDGEWRVASRQTCPIRP